MTKIKLTNRKSPNSSSPNQQLNGSNGTLNNNNSFIANGSSLVYRPLSAHACTSATSNDEYIDSQVR